MKKLTKNIFLSLTAILMITACDDYLDINDSPNLPIDVATPGLMTGAQIGVGNDFGYQFFMSEVLQAYVHQNTMREEGGRYDATTGNGPNQNTWDNFYGSTLPSLDLVINQATAENNMQYVGVAQILKAFAYSRMVDLYGDVPFTEANQNPQVNSNPVFDDDQMIYDSCFILINLGLANLDIDAENAQTIGDDDLFYSGNLNNWKRFANTLKLNLYNHIRLTPGFNASEVQNLIGGGNLIQSASQDFQFNFSETQSPSDERNPLFVTEYGGGQITHYISPYLYEMLQGWNQRVFTDIEDPRAPYYYAVQLAPDEAPENPSDYWDPATGFSSIRFASVGPNVDGAQRSSATMVGNYICGGKFGGILDEAGSDPFGILDGTGIAPYRLLTYYDRLFIEAELYQSGAIAGNAAEKLEMGIRAAFDKVNEVASGSGVAPQLAIDEIDSYVAAVMAEFNSADAETKMEIIMTQKWLANYGNTLECYNDYRRTGYPVFPDAETSPEYQLPGINDAETVLTRSYPLTEFWPASELNTNFSAPEQKTPTSYRVFWDVD